MDKQIKEENMEVLDLTKAVFCVEPVTHMSPMYTIDEDGMISSDHSDFRPIEDIRAEEAPVVADIYRYIARLLHKDLEAAGCKMYGDGLGSGPTSDGKYETRYIGPDGQRRKKTFWIRAFYFGGLDFYETFVPYSHRSVKNAKRI